MSHFESRNWILTVLVVALLVNGTTASAAEPEPAAAATSPAADSPPAEQREVESQSGLTSGAGIPSLPAAPPAPAKAAVAEPPPAPSVSKELAQLLAQSGFVDAGPNGFALRSADKQAQLRFHLQIQVDGKFWHGTTPAKAPETFLVRRAIPWIDGTLPGCGVSFLIAPDLAQITTTNSAAQGNAALNLSDAYLQLKIFDELQLRFGKFRAPIGLERLQPTGQLFFNEFSVGSELTPLRDVGAQAQGEIGGGHAGYAVGIFNGAVDNGYTDIDPSRYKDVEGMVYVRPFGPASPDLLQYAVLGVAGTAGRKSGGAQASGQSTNLPTFKSPGGSTIFSYKAAGSGTAPDTTNTAIASGQQRRFNVHGYYSVGPLGLLAEYIYSQQRVGLDGNNVTAANQGWTAEASIFLFGGKASYSSATIRSPFDLKAGTFGALELVGRASELRLDNDIFGAKSDQTKPVDEATSVKRATELAGGINWYWSRTVRLMLSCNHTSYKGGVAGGDRPAENLLTGRAQISY